nr:MAG TPA: endosialidase chaperone [Caudoviricetes sp.]
MDFTNVINAIDRLVKNRVGAAAYTRMFIAVVQGVEDTETNTYKISYDGGKTSVTAITIAPDVNETVYKKGDSVQVLQLNGDGNTNLYILGKNSDITQKNIDELDSHFITKNTHKVGDTLEFRLNDESNVVETIKSFGSFIIGATFSVDNSKEVYNYGIKITLSFGQKGTATYIFDTYQMLGQPWNYKGIRQEFKQKIDEFYCPYLETITLEKFAAADHESQTEIKDIEISSALLHEANVYTAEFKGSKTGLDFITEKQAGKNNTTLQVLFYKNNIFFASEKCKYYWFRRDESVDSGNEHYHQYGGKGWYLLNSTETQTSLDGDKEITETIVKNNIGNSLQISNKNANQYHNYFKCVVEYGMYTAATEEKEILNLDSTALSFSLTTDSNVITKLDENTVLNIKLDLNDSGNQVNLIKWSYQKDNTGSREYIITAGTEKELNLVNTASTEAEATRKISNILGLQHTTFYCTLINTSVNPIVTLGEAKLIITRDLSTELTEEIWYHDNGDSIDPPTGVNTVTWTTDLSKLGDVSSKYIFAASRMVSPTYQGPFGDIYCYSAHGTGAAAAQLTEFNRLTHNGKDQGLYYAKNNTINKLYINADYINTGTLRVGDQDKEKFYASIGDKKVKIGGFTVGETDLKWGPDLTDLSKGYVYLGQKGLQLGPNFKIDPQGNIDWNANNSPIRQKYSEGNTWPIDTSWHDSKQDNDKYYAQSSDGGDTWAGPFLIQGEKGKDGTSITSITNYYFATNKEDTPDANAAQWKGSISDTDFNETNKYLWIKQVTEYVNKEPPSENLIYLASVYGQKGADGTSVNVKASKAECKVAGDAYIDELGNLQVLTDVANRIFTNAGQIKGDKGDNGVDGTGIYFQRQYLLTTTNSQPSSTDENWQGGDKPLLKSETPFLWCKDRYYKVDKNGNPIKDGDISTLIYLLESLPFQTYVKYVDMNELKFNADGTGVEPTGLTVNMKDVPDANSGWMGTYSGYSQTAPDSYTSYKWTYYLAEINRTNFMANVLDKEKDADGNPIDGIYTEENTTTGKKYIGINASAINTGSLKVTDGTNTIFNANISDKKVDIAGWNISKDQISKNGIGMYSGDENTEASLVEEGISPIRFYTGRDRAEETYKENFITSIQLGYENGYGDVIWYEVSTPATGFFKYTIENNKIKLDSQEVNPGGGTLTNVKINNLEVNFSYYGDGVLYLGLDEFISVFPDFITSSSIKKSKFKVLEDGSLYASAAQIKGQITANGGSIGGWELGKDLLTSGSVGLYSGGKNVSTSLVDSTTTSSVRIFAGINLTVFKLVFADSESLSTNRSVFTDLTFTITETEEYFKLDPNTELLINDSQKYLQINDRSSILERVSSKEEIKKYNNSFYIEVINGNTIIYINRNALLTESKFKVLEDGSLYASAASIEGNINATSGSIGGFRIEEGELKGRTETGNSTVIFRPRATGDASAVLEHTTKSSSSTSSVTIGANDVIYFSKYKDTSTVTERANLSIGSISTNFPGSSQWIYKNQIEASAGDLELKVASSNCKGKLLGTWYKDTSEITTSSRNKKHDIEELDNRYSTLLDNLKPVRFKYNDGVSNRYHTGLILDEMKDAMDTAQMDSSEFAAYCVQDKETGDGGIRYEELIALLIKEVQSLKTQVNVLTEKLNKLEEK